MTCAYYKPLLKLADRGKSHVWSDFLEIVRCSLSFGTQEKLYLETVKKYSPSDLEFFAEALGTLVSEMDKNWFVDLLGPVYMEYFQSKGGRDGGGEFYTPLALSKVCARMVSGKPESFPIRIEEPACGAGQMILCAAEAYWELHNVSPANLRVRAIDVSRTACLMCWINTTLWKIPTQVIWGNALSLEVFETMPNPWYPHPFLEILNCFEKQDPPTSPQWVQGQLFDIPVGKAVS